MINPSVLYTYLWLIARGFKRSVALEVSGLLHAPAPTDPHADTLVNVGAAS